MIRSILTDMRPDPVADRIVPPTGHTAWLTQFAAGVMAFLAVFALALSMAAGRLADRWEDALDRTATIRIPAPAPNPDGGAEDVTQTVLALLQTTPGIANARALTDDEQRALLAPWFGPDLPLDDLPIPRLIELTEEGTGYDAEGLRQRLAAEAPGAILDDHDRWRRPLAVAAGRLQMLGLGAVLLILGATGAVITLAAKASLASNDQVIRVLRQIGARDTYIARAFVRRFTLRTLAGAGAGTLAGLVMLWLLPSGGDAGGFLTGLGFQGFGWLWAWTLPPLAAAIAFAATRATAFARLGTMR